MSPTDAKALFASGESRKVELKRELSSRRPEQIGKEIAALATVKGGYLFIGVDDDGKVYGVPDPKLVQSRIESWISAYVTPIPNVDFAIISVEEREILCVEVREGSYPVYSMDGRPYVRVGTKSEVATSTQVEVLHRHSEVSLELQRLEASLDGMAISLAPHNNTAAAIMGQGELATMNYKELRDLLVADLSSIFLSLNDTK